MTQPFVLNEPQPAAKVQPVASHTKDAFHWCIAPMSGNEFTSQYWEQQPYVLSRGNRNYYSQLFTLSDLSALLENGRFAAADMRVVAKGQQPAFSEYAKPGGRLDTGKLSELYLNGYSIVVHSVEHFNQQVAAFTQSLKQFFSGKAFVNAYLTPRGTQALKAHYDNHDVLVLQIEGSKKWNLYHSAMNCPLHGSFQPTFEKDELPAPQEILLNKGDFMYVPRGWVHDAAATNESSLHLTIGIHPVQWIDFLTKSLQVLSFTHQPLRKALPPGFLNDPDMINVLQNQLQQLTALFNAEGSAAHAYNILQGEYLAAENITGDGSLIHTLDRIAEITAASIVTKRAGISTRLIRTGDHINIEFTNAQVQAPVTYLEAFSFIAGVEGDFMVTDIPGLPEEKKTALVQRLVRDGLLLFKE